MPFNAGDGFRRGKKGNPARRPERRERSGVRRRGQARRQIRSRSFQSALETDGRMAGGELDLNYAFAALDDVVANFARDGSI
jgi:hypothetical protein